MDCLISQIPSQKRRNEESLASPKPVKKKKEKESTPLDEAVDEMLSILEKKTICSEDWTRVALKHGFTSIDGADQIFAHLSKDKTIKEEFIRAAVLEVHSNIAVNGKPDYPSVIAKYKIAKTTLQDRVAKGAKVTRGKRFQ